MNNKALAVAIASICGASTAWAATCHPNDRGDPHGDKSKTTMVATRIDGPWDHYFWRGKDNGRVDYCNPGGASDCDFRWDSSFSRSTTWGIGGGANAGDGGKSWWSKAAKYIIPTFNAKFEKQTQRVELFGMTQKYRRGQWAEPVMVQSRRWEAGYFRGGWVDGGQSANDDKPFCYNFNSSVTYGAWGSHAAVGSPYRTILFHNNRP